MTCPLNDDGKVAYLVDLTRVKGYCSLSLFSFLWLINSHHIGNASVSKIAFKILGYCLLINVKDLGRGNITHAPWITSYYLLANIYEHAIT